MSNIFILRDDDRRKNAIRYLESVNISGRLLEVTIKPYRKNRSNAQNRLMWMWYGTLSDDLGYSTDELHELCKARFLGVEERQILGESVFMARSTTKITTIEFTDYLNKIEALAIELGITLPRPADIYEEAFNMGRRS